MDAAELERIVDDARSAGVRAAAGGDRATRRLRGQVFTPPRLARLVARAVLAPLAGGARVTGERLRVLDPAAGDGAFLQAAREVAAELAIDVDLIGVERDAALARACRAAVPGAVVHEAEALLGLAAALPPMDAVLGNPPYVRSIRLKASDRTLWSELRGRFAATTRGEWDLYGAFLERALAWVRPGGRIGLVTPSRWLTAAWARDLRASLAATGAVQTIVDFGAAQVFADATTYASIVILQRGAGAAPATRLTRGEAGWSSARFDPRAVGHGAWLVPVIDDEPRASGLARRADPPVAGPLRLGDVARIAKGTGTNADPVFVLAEPRVDGTLVHARGCDGTVVTVELAATRPCWRGRDIQDDASTPRARCIVPYDVDDARGASLIPWPTFAARWPRAAAYLERHRARLEARERGRFAGARFHCFGRPQNLAFLLDRAPKVLVPDVCRAPRAVIDAGGALVLDTAYALRPRAGAPPPWDDIAALHALMRSSHVPAWLARAGAPLRGDYRRWKTAYLAPMPLPLA